MSKEYSAYEIAVEALNQAAKIAMYDQTPEEHLAVAEKVRLWLFDKGELTSNPPDSADPNYVYATDGDTAEDEWIYRVKGDKVELTKAYDREWIPSRVTARELFDQVMNQDSSYKYLVPEDVPGWAR